VIQTGASVTGLGLSEAPSLVLVIPAGRQRCPIGDAREGAGHGRQTSGDGKLTRGL
jgi:hypothetical protein